MLNADTYISSQKGIGGTIRNRYEDFYVEEIPLENPSGEGPNLWIWIEKLGRTTLDVLMDISRDLHISRKRMGFAGMKDKRAITRQWICISNIDSQEQYEEVLQLKDKIHNTQFLDIKRGQKKLRMGQLIGNKFKILIKDIDNIEKSVTVARDVLNLLEQTGVPNYYGWQRFGKPRSNTHLVGKYIVLNDLKEAVRRYIGNPNKEESEEIIKARTAYDNNNLEESLELFPTGMRYERIMLRELIKENNKLLKKQSNEKSNNKDLSNDINENINLNNNDNTSNNKNKDTTLLDDISYKKAIFSLPKPLQRMFVNAYQSYLFNAVVSERIKLGINDFVDGDIIIDNEEHLIHDKTNEELNQLIKEFKAHPTAPLYGTKVPLAKGKPGEIEQKVLKKENIQNQDFLAPKTPKLGSHGLRRAIRFKVWNSKVEAKEEGIQVEFSIDKGSYAT
ncbi:MAG: tRNA pseudouridine(13) synthase TruD, partial [Methanobrevibacter sp.]|nr:tRNA pseudouridine(13) synthase TruD [Methanobrevibacter sp.]